MIGGTSIGSFIGGLYACEQTIEKVDPIAQSWAEKGASLWFYFLGNYNFHKYHFFSFLK